MREPAIEDHAVVGDGRSAALVDRAGAVTWLAWPGFDSPPICAAILDAERGLSLIHISEPTRPY